MTPKYATVIAVIPPGFDVKALAQAWVDAGVKPLKLVMTLDPVPFVTDTWGEDPLADAVASEATDVSDAPQDIKEEV